ncbi:MAG: hypothetical protein NW701_16335 [Nitrospira sp.]
MQRPHDDIENARIADNLRRAIELTELALALRQAVLQQGASDNRGMVEVMRDIRRTKEQAWRQTPS